MHNSTATRLVRRPNNPTLPTHNKPLQMKRDQKYYNEHQEKLKKAKPMVDTKAPATYMHLHLKPKKLQLEEERLATVEKNNRILLEKMSYVKRTRGRVDNSNAYTEYKSLNREKRQRYLSRVTEENLAMLYRVIDRQPEYSRKKWQQEWEKNQRLMESISHFHKIIGAHEEQCSQQTDSETTQDQGLENSFDIMKENTNLNSPTPNTRSAP